jgi:hypothetical protein
LSGGGIGPNEGDARHEVEHGQHQELLGLGADLHQVVVAEVSIDEREQVALGVLVAELLDDLVDQILRQALVEASSSRQSDAAGIPLGCPR